MNGSYSLEIAKSHARELFRMGGEIAGKRPRTLITDGLPAYRDAFNKEFYTNNKPQSQHINAIKLTGHENMANNNKMERINGEIRDREKVMRGLKIKENSHTSRNVDLLQFHKATRGVSR